jgi:hypothetical protein
VTGSGMMEDAVIACAGLVGRAGATDFEIGYLHDDVPVEEAGWYAAARWRGTRITADDHKSPTLAAIALAERLLRSASCRCGRLVAMADGQDGCRWRLVGQRWEPGCDAPSVKVNGERGDLSAMNRAMRRAAKRRERRRAERRAKP